jgi:hypothetical protein
VLGDIEVLAQEGGDPGQQLGRTVSDSSTARRVKGSWSNSTLRRTISWIHDSSICSSRRVLASSFSLRPGRK